MVRNRKREMPPRPGVARDVVLRYGGTRQDELTAVLSRVHRTTNVIPDARIDLPLVYEAWRVTREHQARIDVHGAACVVVDVKQNLAGGLPAGGLRLAAGSRSLDQHGPGGSEPVGEFRVGNPWEVPCHPSQPSICNSIDPAFATLSSGHMQPF